MTTLNVFGCARDAESRPAAPNGVRAAYPPGFGAQRAWFPSRFAKGAGLRRAREFGTARHPKICYAVIVNRLPPSDTDPRIEAFLVEGYRAMSAVQKLGRVRALTQAIQELALLDVRRRHPDAGSREQALRVASRWLDADLMVRAFNWDPRQAGF